MKIDELSPEIRAKAAHILDKLTGVELPSPAGYYLLCVQWITPQKVGSIYMPHQRHSEDKFQGRAGLVLALGPDCYAGDRYPNGPWCEPGDWVAWPMMENAASRIEYNGCVLTVIPDDRVVLVGVDPERVS
jgi:hypothetical protein